MSVKNFLPPLVDDIIGNFPNSAAVKIEKQIDDFVLGVKVLSPLGLIVNELITNAMKYAFIGRDNGMITVAASTKDNRMTLTFQDNWNGIPDSVDRESSIGFGFKLVGMLAKQLHGTIRIERKNGTKIILEFEI
jgi:two-component sensor histidine kinase